MTLVEHKLLLLFALIIIAVIVLLILNTNTRTIVYQINPVRFLQVTKVNNLCTNKFEEHIRRKSQNVLSYTMFGKWGKDPFWHGRIDLVAKEANESAFYHDWTVRVYHDDMLDFKAQQYLLSRHENLIFCDISNIPGHEHGELRDMAGSEWRFLPIGDPSVGAFCSRDIDSPLIQREFDAISQWLRSGKYFHVMRDHPQHTWPIMAGMWCVRNDVNRIRSDYIFQLIIKLHHTRVDNKEPTKLSDQFFLRDHVWPLVTKDIMQHDSYHCDDIKPFKIAGGLTPFPYPREKSTSEFMGCKRPCNTRTLPPCPVKCRPIDHQDWVNC